MKQRCVGLVLGGLLFAPVRSRRELAPSINGLTLHTSPELLLRHAIIQALHDTTQLLTPINLYHC